jgi:hypothetical protein
MRGQTTPSSVKACLPLLSVFVAYRVAARKPQAHVAERISRPSVEPSSGQMGTAGMAPFGGNGLGLRSSRTSLSVETAK